MNNFLCCILQSAARNILHKLFSQEGIQEIPLKSDWGMIFQMRFEECNSSLCYTFLVGSLAT